MHAKKRSSLSALCLSVALAGGALAADRVKTANGTLEAATAAGARVRMFKGIPFAEPPTGDLRWKPPQPVKSWKGVKQAAQFGPRCMQPSLYSDMMFRSNGMSEDCLYLNVWTPAKKKNERLPVLVYFFGGGYQAGDGSEYRYDGESMAGKGIVAVTVNYRLGLFGFFSHPELATESPHHASGNYGLMDQSEALRWVHKNIAAFGGDPNKVTIAGESAGSASVSAQMASPLSRDLIAGAIGESGALISPTLPPRPASETEQDGVKFAMSTGAANLAAMRALPAEKLIELLPRTGGLRFRPNVDGYFLPKTPAAIFEAGEQAHVPLLAGWNSEEQNGRSLLGRNEGTPENFAKAVRVLYGDRADELLKLYPASTAEETMQSATDLAGDRFIAFSTWKWAELQAKTGGKPVYRYFYSRPRPATTAGGPAARGAAHSAEIEYAMGNLATNKVYAWTEDDQKVSKVMQEFFANFVKTRNPNGQGLPEWPAFTPGSNPRIMHIDVETRAEPEKYRGRYLLLDQVIAKPAS